MAAIVIKMSEVPVLTRVGKVTVTARGNGQLAFSSLASKGLKLETHKFFTPLFDAKTRKLTIKSLSTDKPKKAELAEGYIGSISVAKKSGVAFVAASGILQFVGYEYKASGNQQFDAEVTGDGEVTFIIPKGSLEPKPVVARGPKAKTVAAGANASTTVEDEDEDEPTAEEVDEDEDDE